MRSLGFSWWRATTRSALALLLGWALALPHLALAGMGLGEIPATATDGPITLYYPTQAPEQLVARGRMRLSVAENGAPLRGNGRLVVISHGSGGSPWVHADLAHSLVDAGFVIAMPQHHADNYRDDSNPGPDSWAIRPQEVSRAIDAVAQDSRFAPLLDLQHVGVYGMSAGGHTALSMAGGRWSIAGFRDHCEAHLEEDFQACVGLITRLNGGLFDGIKKWAARTIIRHRFSDETLLSHTDARVTAVVAGVPAAADFDMASFAQPRAALGLVTAGHDRWLIPRFHSDRVLQACPPCERVAELPTAGHGALLSPLPPGLTGLLGDMLNDPPDFDRAQMGAVNTRITAFFVRHLVP
jgi:predicted dienelactone hydrolase